MKKSALVQSVAVLPLAAAALLLAQGCSGRTAFGNPFDNKSGSAGPGPRAVAPEDDPWSAPATPAQVAVPPAQGMLPATPAPATAQTPAATRRRVACFFFSSASAAFFCSSRSACSSLR